MGSYAQPFLIEDLPTAALASIPPDAVEHGEVFTRRWVVEFILDLAGYTADRDLAAMTAIEPACGTGAFVGPMVSRLSAACRAHGKRITEAKSSIRALDLLPHNVDECRRVVVRLLTGDGWPMDDVAAVAEEWVQEGDYILHGHREGVADFVLGNPPYIRLEDVPSDRMAAYRARCRTMTGRSDVYVGFYEWGLRSLRPGGILGFICADRWMRNQYGSELRKLIQRHYSVDGVITMHDVDAFEERVSAYPAISIIRRGPQGEAIVANAMRTFGPTEAEAVLDWTQRPTARTVVNDAFEIGRVPRWFSRHDSWPTGSPSRLRLIDNLNERFEPLEDHLTGTRIGIGVATGADEVFVTKVADVETDRLLPLSLVRDTISGQLHWSGHYLVNPWDSRGMLVDLAKYPLLRRYFDRNVSALRSRHVGRRQPTHWYRTIDKVDHSLTARPKLLLPDMKMKIHPVFDPGGYYPHHNLYYVVSDSWDLTVLGGLLLSRVAEAFIDAYAVKMRGGTLRFQAQYLRRIRVPRQGDISKRDRMLLSNAFSKRDVDAATQVASRIYGVDLTTKEA